MKHRFLLALVGALAFIAGYGAVTHALPYGRSEYYGYFKNEYDAWGTNIWPTDSTTSGCAASGGNALPTSVNTAEELISFVGCKAVSANATSGVKYQERYGGSFIVLTMSGNTGSTIGSTSDTRFQDWARDVRYAEKMGWINWSATYSYTTNTYWQGTGSGTNVYDDAWYSEAGSASAITFKNAAGTVVYAIRRQCANPIAGNNGPPAIPDSDWTMTGQVNATATTIGVNDTVTFTSQVKNAGPAIAYYDWYVRYCWDTCVGGFASGYGGHSSSAGNTQAANNTWVTKDTWAFNPGGSAAHTQLCVWIAFTNATGYGTAAGNSNPMTCVAINTGGAACGSLTVSPGSVDPTDTYTVTGMVNISGGAANATAVDTASNVFINITGPGVAYTNSNVMPTTIGTSGTYGTITASVSPGATNNAGSYTVSYGIVGPSSPITCSGSFTVSYTPYFSIQGGDVTAGPGFGTACAPALSQIKASNLGSAKGYYGASTQLGAFSLAQITGFATNTKLDSVAGTGSPTTAVANTQPSGLAFSNTGVGSTIWGYSFGKDPADDASGNSSWCTTDYYDSAAGASTAPTVLSAGDYTLDQTKLNGLVSGRTYQIDGNLTTSGDASSNLYLGGSGQPTRITLIVNGDVNLASNIKYGTYSYIQNTNTMSVVPQFRLLVNGNIFVDKAVTQLNGFYYAKATGSNTGNVYTCGSGFGFNTNASGDTATNYILDANYYDDCKNQLTVYGAMAADYMRLNRSGGSWKKTPSVNNNPAELIVYPPELWLGSVHENTAGNAQPFDAITSLPPIL